MEDNYDSEDNNAESDNSDMNDETWEPDSNDLQKAKKAILNRSKNKAAFQCNECGKFYSSLAAFQKHKLLPD